MRMSMSHLGSRGPDLGRSKTNIVPSDANSKDGRNQSINERENPGFISEHRNGLLNHSKTLLNKDDPSMSLGASRYVDDAVGPELEKEPDR